MTSVTGPGALDDSVHIRTARIEDLAAVADLLRGAQLPTDGLDDQFGPAYAVAEVQGTVVGAEGIEVYATAGLLRSAVVASSLRGRRVGDALTRNRLAWARAHEGGLKELWLLTTTAAEYFARFGFHTADRAMAPDTVRQSREFRETCPASAVAMRLDLTQESL